MNAKGFTSLAALCCLSATASQQCESDSEWGCCAIICMADPSGPQTQSDCVSPINRLRDVLKRGGSMPTCKNARIEPASFDECPPGTAEAEGFVRLDAPMARSAADNGYVSADAELIYQDTSRTGLTPTAYQESRGVTPGVYWGQARVCVAGEPRGSFLYGFNGMPVQFYDAIYVQPIQTGNVIKVTRPDGSTWTYRLGQP